MSSLPLLNSPPEADQLEVSVFGPGRGESCVVHLGANEWMVVDSCRDQRSGASAPLSYLASLGVEIGTAVKLVVATHAHDDHIAGIAEVFEACESAFFVMPNALTREEFGALLEIDVETTKDLRKRNFSEYRRVREIVKGRSQTGVLRAKYAAESRELFRRHGESQRLAVVRSLSPSDRAFDSTLQKMRDYFPTPDSEMRPPHLDPNELAVALWVELGDQRALLGADLLSGPDGCGWAAVLETYVPDGPAGIYKVPHHGSSTAEHSGVWAELLEASPVALLAPYRARYVVPNEDEVRVLLNHTDRVYACASPKAPSPPRGVRETAATLSQVARNVREPWGKVGHVRARVASTGRWDVDLFGPARRLS